MAMSVTRAAAAEVTAEVTAEVATEGGAPTRGPDQQQPQPEAQGEELRAEGEAEELKAEAEAEEFKAEQELRGGGDDAGADAAVAGKGGLRRVGAAGAGGAMVEGQVVEELAAAAMATPPGPELGQGRHAAWSSQTSPAAAPAPRSPARKGSGGMESSAPRGGSVLEDITVFGRRATDAAVMRPTQRQRCFLRRGWWWRP
eukprot:gene53651-5432_t